MDTCLQSVNADVQTVAMRKNQAAPDGKTCLWSNVEGHPSKPQLILIWEIYVQSVQRNGEANR